MKRIHRCIATVTSLSALAACSAAQTDSPSAGEASVTASAASPVSARVHSYLTPAGETAFFSEVCPPASEPGHAQCFALAKSDALGNVTAGNVTADNVPAGWGAHDLQLAYRLPATAGESDLVAVVNAQDNPNAEADLTAYRTQYGLPSCTSGNGCFQKVSQTGASSPLPTPDIGWGTEIALDLDMVSAGCPNCRILLVEANTSSMSDLEAAVHTAIRMGAHYVTNSYGGAEWSGMQNTDAAEFNFPGVSIFASSGDGAYGSGIPSYPASSQYVTAVGGTSLTQSATARGWSETAWGGAGSGCSGYIPKPSWETTTLCSTRAVADVSAVANPGTGVAVYDTYGQSGWVVVGGTSVSSPLVASSYASLGRRSGPSLSYWFANAFNDVTSGSTGGCGNALCNAGPGWDGPTGNGTIDGTELAGARLLSGDFNGDGKADLALVGGLGWSTIPVAFSNGDGTFNVTNLPNASFSSWGASGGTPLAGDFNGDGKTDLAITGVAWWNTLPVAFSNGDGTFRTTNLPAAAFAAESSTAGVRVVAGDFNGDGRADIAAMGGAGWNTVPVAFSNGDGTFTATNSGVANFPGYATGTTQRPVAGDFNGDGKADIALTGGAGWNTLPIAFSNGNGTFTVTNDSAPDFASYATAVGTHPVAGDFNGDGRADVALTGGTWWASVPVAFSNGNGTFSVSNIAVPNFPADAAVGAAQAVAGDFNGDHKADIALAGGVGWNTVPVAFSNGSSFRVTNDGVANFPAYANQ